MKAAYYQDIILYPGDGAPISVLQSALFNRLHKLFAKMKNEHNAQYALAFPGIGPKGLGRVFRVFAENIQDLLELDIAHISIAFFGTMDFRNPKAVPEGCAFIRYARKHDQTSLERRIAGIRRRFKNAEDRDRAIAASHEKEFLDLPFVWTTSTSSAGADGIPKKFPMHITVGETDRAATAFNAYGLPLTEGGVPDIR